MLITWRKNKSTFNVFFIVYLTSPRLTLGHCQLLLPERGEEEHEKYIFPLKMVFPWKIFFGSFWVRKWWLPLTLDVIQLCERMCICHLCSFVSSSQEYQKYSRRLFYIYRNGFWKNVITFWSHITWPCVYIYR